MKNYVICTLIMLCVLSADAEWVRISGRSEVPIPPTKEVIKSDSSGVLIRNVVCGFTEEDTTIDSKYFKRIYFPDEHVLFDTSDAGKPQIPYIKLVVAIPDSCEYEISTNTGYYSRSFSNYLLYPIPEIVVEDTGNCIFVREVYSYDEQTYGTDTFYPGIIHEVNDDGYWRDQRILEISLYPIQFNPVHEIIHVYDNIDLTITYTGDVVQNENGLGPFEELGRELLLNYPGINKEPESVPAPDLHYYTYLQNPDNIADYIIVTHDDFLADVQDSLTIHEFAAWRVSHNEFHVGVIKTTDIFEEFLVGQDSARALQDFLIYAYDNWRASTTDGHFAYCLFIGDWDYVPAKLSIHDEVWVVANEWYFRDFYSGGGDEIMLGRWPVKATDATLDVIA